MVESLYKYKDYFIRLYSPNYGKENVEDAIQNVAFKLIKPKKTNLFKKHSKPAFKNEEKERNYLSTAIKRQLLDIRKKKYNQLEDPTNDFAMLGGFTLPKIGIVDNKQLEYQDWMVEAWERKKLYNHLEQIAQFLIHKYPNKINDKNLIINSYNQLFAEMVLPTYRKEMGIQSFARKKISYHGVISIKQSNNQGIIYHANGSKRINFDIVLGGVHQWKTKLIKNQLVNVPKQVWQFDNQKANLFDIKTKKLLKTESL